ncbi:ATP-grasp domain-containing protein [Phytohabitans suffuscus]|nr:ATP-grasp domain-containing protein [Phytohabitans suffuscus]
MTKRLLMVTPYVQFVHKAQAEGFWVAAIWDPAQESADYLQSVREAADAFELTDFRDDAGLRKAIRETAHRHGVSSIYHIGREDSMISAFEVAEELGLSLNPPSAIRLLADKLAMRERLAQRNLSTVVFAAAGTRAEVPAAVAGIGAPVVVKPTSLAGSRGVFLWQSDEDRATWFEILDAYGYPGPFLVEEYLRGPEYSVETLSVDGVHQVVGITQKFLGPPPLFVEVGHLHPAPLPAERRDAIEELTVAFLDACGYRFGPAHTEVIWTPGGPRIVESQPRLGGDRIPRLVELSSGFDLERAIFAALAGRPTSPTPHTGTALVRFFTLPSGRIDSVHNVESVRLLPYVDELELRVRPGDTVAAVRDSKSRHGHVIVTAQTPPQAVERCTEVLSLVEVVVDGAPAPLDAAPDRITEGTPS